MQILSVGPLILTSWTSSGICPGFWSQSGSLACLFSRLNIPQIHLLLSVQRSVWQLILFDLQVMYPQALVWFKPMTKRVTAQRCNFAHITNAWIRDKQCPNLHIIIADVQHIIIADVQHIIIADVRHIIITDVQHIIIADVRHIIIADVRSISDLYSVFTVFSQTHGSRLHSTYNYKYITVRQLHLSSHSNQLWKVNFEFSVSLNYIVFMLQWLHLNRIFPCWKHILYIL